MSSVDKKTEHTVNGSLFHQSAVITLIFTLGIALSMAAFFHVRSWEQTEFQNLFEISARNRLAAFHADIISHQEVVSSLAALFPASQHVTREEFRVFVQENLSTHPDIQALGWNPLIKYSERKLFEEKTQEEGFHNFRITEVDINNQQQIAAVRNDYIAVHYVEPYSGNEEAHGFDIASHPGRLVAIEKARDTGQVVITERIRLVQEKQDRFGYLMLKAVYHKGTRPETVNERRKHFMGVAAGVFRFSESVHFIMRNIQPLGIDVWITDLSAPLDKQFLHFHPSRTREKVYKPTPENRVQAAGKGFHLQTTLDVAGRKWSFLFTPAPAFYKAHQLWQCWITLAAGLLFTVLLTLFFRSKIYHVARLATANRELHKQISVRQQAEEALRQHEKKYQILFENMAQGAFYQQADGTLVDYNLAALEMFGLTADEFIGRTSIDPRWKVIHEDGSDFPGEQHPSMEALRTGRPVYNVVAGVFNLRKEEYVWLSINAIPQFHDGEDKPYQVFVTLHDITDRILAEEAIKEREIRLSALFDNTADGILVADPQTSEFISCNEAMANMLGYHVDEVVGKKVKDLHREEDLSHAFEQFKLITSEKTTVATNIIFQRKDGSVFNSDVTGFPFVIEGKRYIGGFFRDVTEHKIAEDKLRKLSEAVHNAGELVMITDSKSVIEYVNPAFCEVTGYSSEEVIGKTPAILKSSAQERRKYDELWQTISSGNVWHGSLIDMKKDGTFFPVLSSIVPICDQGGLITNYVSLQQDMTEYKSLEEQFIHSQKMESIGVLVGGIAHDFNNMLAGIMGNIFLAKSEATDNPKLLKRLEMINSLSDRAANMIKQLLAFARKDVLTMKTFSFTKFLKEAVKLAMTSIPENIDKQYDFTQDDLIVNGDTTQLQQVLMNLINNARDALENSKGGIITCALKEYIPDNAFRNNHPDCKEDKYACLTVSDNGKGIPEDVINKVFDPFFTTKGVGEGTGLGLSMVYGTIETHHGAIDLDSIPGQGATFNIYLPIVSEKAKELVLEQNEVVKGEKELVLIADDEAILLELEEELLWSLGYRTITAHNGEEAIQVFEQYKNEVSLVILDVVMPILGGADAAKEIRRINDKVPIIFATGYDKNTALKNVGDIPNHEIITKPYSAESLSQVICRCLN